MKTYEDLAGSAGYPDPVKYLFGRFKAHVQSGNEAAAIDLAKFLIPYGLGKRGPVDEQGETVRPAVLELE